MSNLERDSRPEPAENKAAKPLPAFALFTLSLFLVVLTSLFPDQRVWGFNWYNHFDTRVLVTVVVVALWLVFLFFRHFEGQSTERNGSKSNLRYYLIASAIILIAGFAFVRLSGATHFLGDGYQLLSKLAEDSPLIKPWDQVSFFIQQQVYNLIDNHGADGAKLTFRLVSYACGFLFVVMTVIYAAARYEGVTTRLLFVLGLLSSGYSLMFFGYVENYPPFLLAVAAFGLIGSLAAERKANKWWILLPLFCAALLHPFAVALLPSALYLLGSGTRVGAAIKGLPIAARIVNGALVVGVVVAVTIWQYQSSYFFRFSPVPLLSDIFTVEGYTMSSSGHLLDYLYLLFMLMPGVFILLLILPGSIRLAWRGNREFRFIFGMLLPSLAAVFVFSPGLGMPRDWDLFAFAGIPLTLLFFLTVLNSDRTNSHNKLLAAMAIILGFAVLTPRVSVQADGGKSVDLFLSYARLDRIRNTTGRYILYNYYKAAGEDRVADDVREENDKLLPARVTYRRGVSFLNLREYAAAKKRFHKTISHDPTYKYAWTDLGEIYRIEGNLDSALYCLKVSDGLNPYNYDTNRNLALVYHALGDSAAVEYRWSIAHRLDPESVEPVDSLISIYEANGELQEFREILLSGIEVHAQPRYAVRLAVFYAERKERDMASEFLTKAIQLGLDSSAARTIASKYELKLVKPASPDSSASE